MSAAPILLVEDNPDTVVLLKRALRKADIPNEVVVATDGQEALDWLFCEGGHRDRDPEVLPAVVLLDLKLPKVGGIEVLERLRTSPRVCRLPVVVLTSSRLESDVSRCYDLRANSYVQKPVDYDAFVRAVGQLGTYWLFLNEPPPPAGGEPASAD